MGCRYVIHKRGAENWIICQPNSFWDLIGRSQAYGRKAPKCYLERQMKIMVMKMSHGIQLPHFQPETWSLKWVARFIPLNLDAGLADDMIIEKRWKKIVASHMEVQINQNLLSFGPPPEPPNSTRLQGSGSFPAKLQ